MKALVISDKQEIIESLKSYLADNNYDIIIYRWLLKALDNIEEIRPDIIVLSASEYPRHWKTLASFVQSGIGGNDVKVYLYDPEPLEKEEKEKAEKLGIEAFIDSLSLEELSKIAVKSEEKKVENKKYEMVLTHPDTGRFVFGKAISADNVNLFECEFNPNINLKAEQFIKYVSVYSDNQVKSFTAEVVKADDSENKIILKVKDYYEEEI